METNIMRNTFSASFDNICVDSSDAHASYYEKFYFDFLNYVSYFRFP